jgi:hypothetical protein
MACCSNCENDNNAVASLNGCASSGLGGVSERGYYFLDPGEIRDFWDANRYKEPVRSYMSFGEPEYGVIYRDETGEYIVWYDASGVLHIILATGKPIVEDMDNPKIPIPTKLKVLEEIVNRGVGWMETAGAILLGIALIEAYRRYGKAA